MTAGRMNHTRGLGEETAHAHDSESAHKRQDWIFSAEISISAASGTLFPYAKPCSNTS